MEKISKQVTVDYSPGQMYALVNDVDAYSTFIPLCTASEVHEQQDRRMRATIAIAKGSVGFSFTTVNTLEENRSITMQLEDGPFKTLKGVWHFTPHGEHGCRVVLELEFEFANKLLGVVFGGVYRQLCQAMIDAFCKQAVLRYG